MVNDYEYGVCNDCGCFLSDCICDTVEFDDEPFLDDQYYLDEGFISADDFIDSNIDYYSSSSIKQQKIPFYTKKYKKTEFKNYNELSENFVEYVHYEINVRKRKSPIAIIAPHGGQIEPGTSELAKLIASNKHSFYSFSGYSEKNSRLHITSHNFDEPQCIDCICDKDIVIAIHGCKGTDSKIYIGGRNIRLKNKINARLFYHGFNSSCKDHKFQAMNISNICNRGKTNKGVQIELSRDIRNNKNMLDEISKLIQQVIG